MIGPIIPFALLLLSPIFLVGAVYTWWGATKKAQMSATVVVVLGFTCLGFAVGRFEGQNAFFQSIRNEMNLFLRDLQSATEPKKNAAIRDFLIRGDDVKLQPADYLKDLKGARKLLKKEPNQAPEPTAPSGRGSS